MTEPSGTRAARLRRLGILSLAVALVLTPVVFFTVFTWDAPPAPVRVVLVETLGGETTAFTSTRNAFGLPARNLESDERRTFAVGNSFSARIG